MPIATDLIASGLPEQRELPRQGGTADQGALIVAPANATGTTAQPLAVPTNLSASEVGEDVHAWEASQGVVRPADHLESTVQGMAPLAAQLGNPAQPELSFTGSSLASDATDPAEYVVQPKPAATQQWLSGAPAKLDTWVKTDAGVQLDQFATAGMRQEPAVALPQDWQGKGFSQGLPVQAELPYQQREHAASNIPAKAEEGLERAKERVEGAWQGVKEAGEEAGSKAMSVLERTGDEIAQKAKQTLRGLEHTGEALGQKAAGALESLRDFVAPSTTSAPTSSSTTTTATTTTHTGEPALVEVVENVKSFVQHKWQEFTHPSENSDLQQMTNTQVPRSTLPTRGALSEEATWEAEKEEEREARDIDFARQQGPPIVRERVVIHERPVVSTTSTRVVDDIVAGAPVERRSIENERFFENRPAATATTEPHHVLGDVKSFVQNKWSEFTHAPSTTTSVERPGRIVDDIVAGAPVERRSVQPEAERFIERRADDLARRSDDIALRRVDDIVAGAPVQRVGAVQPGSAADYSTTTTSGGVWNTLKHTAEEAKERVEGLLHVAKEKGLEAERELRADARELSREVKSDAREVRREVGGYFNERSRAVTGSSTVESEAESLADQTDAFVNDAPIGLQEIRNAEAAEHGLLHSLTSGISRTWDSFKEPVAERRDEPVFARDGSSIRNDVADRLEQYADHKDRDALKDKALGHDASYHFDKATSHAARGAAETIEGKENTTHRFF